MAIVPIPCATCGGAAGAGVEGPDVEQVVLCDVLPNGTVAGSAIAVYEYNGTTGLPIGPPTFVAPGTNTPYVPLGVLRPCDEPCVKCETQILCDSTSVPGSTVVSSTMKMLDTANVPNNDGWNVTAYNTSNAPSTMIGLGCPAPATPPAPLPYAAQYMADWCATYLAACPTATAAGSGCAANPGPALGVTNSAEGVGCGGGSTFDTYCARYLLEKTFNTDAACTQIRVTSQRFRADGAAKVMIDGQDTGIFGAYNMSSPDGTIILNVTPGAHTMTIDLRDNLSPTWVQGGLTIECLTIVPPSTTSVEFLRTTCRTCTGTVVSTTDTKLDGTTPYVPGPNVALCGGSSTNVPCTVCDVVVLSDSFTGPNGPACNQFLRTVCHNCDGSFASSKDTLLDGTSPYTPQGSVGSECAVPADCKGPVVIGNGCYPNGPNVFHYAAVRNCDGTVSYYDSATGADVTAIASVVTATCLDTTYHAEILCDNNGPFIRRYETTDNGNVAAPITVHDYSLSGSAYAAVGPVKVCPDDIPAVLPNLAAHHFDALPGTPWTPAAIPPGRLTSLTYTVLAGTATVVDADGTSVAGVPAGYTATWSAQDDRETLTPPQSITADPGSRVLVLMNVATP